MRKQTAFDAMVWVIECKRSRQGCRLQLNFILKFVGLATPISPYVAAGSAGSRSGTSQGSRYLERLAGGVAAGSPTADHGIGSQARPVAQSPSHSYPAGSSTEQRFVGHSLNRGGGKHRCFFACFGLPRILDTGAPCQHLPHAGHPSKCCSAPSI